jgi:adenylate cyclase
MSVRTRTEGEAATTLPAPPPRIFRREPGDEAPLEALRDAASPAVGETHRGPTRLEAAALRLVKPAGDQPSSQIALEELERLLGSSDFDATPRSRAFLRFVVEETLDGRQDGLTQTALATQVFGRRPDFDPTIDPIVRIQAGRLRRSLERYYLLAGGSDPVRIELPRGGYVPVVKWAGSRESGGGTERRRSARPDDWPSVVVGPFRTGSEGMSEEAALRFCERLAFEIGRFGDVRVVLKSELERLDPAPGEAPRFTLSGHLACHVAPGWRAMARLVDGRNARQVWAEEFGTPGPTEPHDELARLIAVCVASEHGLIARTIWAERRFGPPPEPTPYDAVLRSYQFLSSREARDLPPALTGLQRLVEAEPECALAWVQLARLHLESYAGEVGPAGGPEPSIDVALACAHNGTELDPLGQRPRAVLAQALFLKGDLKAAHMEVRRALDLEPRSFADLDTVGWLLTLLGESERGPALVREALERNPNPAPRVFQALWADHLQRGEIEPSWRAAQQYRDPASFWPHVMRASSLGHLGRIAEAKAETAQILARHPDFAGRGRMLLGRLIRVSELFERVRQGLHRAGLALV